MEKSLLAGYIRKGRFPHEILNPGPITLSSFGGTNDTQMSYDSRNQGYKGPVQPGFALHYWDESTKSANPQVRDTEFINQENIDEEDVFFFEEFSVDVMDRSQIEDAAYKLLSKKLLYDTLPIRETARWKKKDELPNEITDDLMDIAVYFIKNGMDSIVDVFEKKCLKKNTVFCILMIDFTSRVIEYMSQTYNKGNGIYLDISQETKETLTKNASKDSAFGAIWRAFGEAIFDDKWVSAIYH